VQTKINSAVRRAIRASLPNRRVAPWAGVLLVATAPGYAQTLPQNGTVVSGQVKIGTPSNNTLTVTQSSARAVINWNSFSVGQPNTVQFNQPNASSATLNRVTGSTASTIAGAIKAPGQIYLVNPNGIAITPTGTVDVGGGFIGSTLAITDQDFNSGKLNFKGDGSSGAVTNAGRINAGPGGFVGLVGGSVTNSGAITVPLGKVALGSGEQATFDLNGDGFMQVAVPTHSNAADGQALVGVSGSITASGGSIQVQAATVRSAIHNAVNVSGALVANSVSEHEGVITLGGDSGGTVAVSGKLDVSGGPGASGGTVTVTGNTVSVASTGTVNASGSSGGAVTIWSNTRTDFNGAINAAATGASGNGGNAEVSSAGVLSYNGTADLRAASGRFGTLLLDPEDVTISSGTDTGATNSGGTFAPTGDNSIINVNTLVNALATANVTVTTGSTGSQAGNITVASALSWSSGGWLTLQAANNIALNAPISAPAGGLALSAGNAISVPAAVSVARFYLQSGNWSQVSGTLPAFSSADFAIAGGTFLRATGGTGTSGDPYILTDIYGVQGMNTLLSSSYALGNNIDAGVTASWNGATGFYSIGTADVRSGGNGFVGNFDGRGYTISNLTINRPSETYVGLFGYVGGGTIQNVGLAGGNITGNVNVGSLVGEGHGTVTQAWSTANVNGVQSWSDVGREVGGLVGQNFGTVSQSYSTGTVTGDQYSQYVGGLVGMNYGTIAQSYALGTVIGGSNSSSVGGLAGYVNGNYGNPGVVYQSYATGAVSGSSSVGGLVGTSGHGTITQSYWDTVTSGQGSGVGSVSGGTVSVMGLTTAQFFDSTQFSGWGFGTAPNASGCASGSAACWVIVNYDGSLNNSGTGAGGATRPMLLSEYSTNIQNAHQLQLVDLDPTAHYTLGTDLDLAGPVSGSASGLWYVQSNASASGYGFAPLGDSTLFSGTFDGQGHTIANLVTNWQEYNVGLFGQVDIGGTVENIAMVNASVAAPGQWQVGALAGFNSGTISGASATGSVSAGGASGGLVGINNGTISQSSAAASVSMTSGFDQAGGLAGLNTGTISQSYATGAVTSTGGPGVHMGGLVGQNTGQIDQSYATGPVSNSALFAGGLVGENDSSITNSYALGSVAGTDYVGGLVGLNSGGATISRTYATGAVSGSAAVGGLVGYNDFGTVSQSYWDTGTTGQIDGAGTLNGGSFSATGLTTTQFADTANFPGWGFGSSVNAAGCAAGTASCWVIVDAEGSLNNSGGVSGATRPMLLSEYSTNIVNAHQLQLVDVNPNASYTLGADIDLAGALASDSGIWFTSNTNPSQYGFAPLGSSANPFSGTFSGQGHTISNLLMSQTAGESLGLFGTIGYTGSVNGIGLVGGSVTADTAVGALAGTNEGSITGSYATSNVTGTSEVGGLVGVNEYATITTSYATGTVNGGDEVGGLVGINWWSDISQTYATGNVSAPGGASGGLVGYMVNGSITASYATGGVSGRYSGGLVGTITGGTITQTYATGAVSGTGYFGGLIGETDGATVRSSFWDSVTTGQNASQGLGYDFGGTTFGATGLTTAQLQDLSAFSSTYAGWDFTSVWAPPNQVGQNNGATTAYYPTLYALSNVIAIVPTSTRTYGSATATPSVNYYGVKAGDYITSLGTFTDPTSSASNVGTYSYSGTGVAATSVVGNTYRYVYEAGALEVTPAPLTYTADGATRTYGSINPTLTGTVTGFVGSDTLSNATTGTLAFGTTATAGSDVGSYAVTGSGLTADNGNYVFVQAGSNATALTINPLAVTLSGTRTYDGSANAAGSILTVTNALVGDTVTISGTGTLAAKDVGSQALTSLSGLTSSNSNYTLVGGSGDVSITAATLTYTAGSASRTYGSANPPLTGTVTGFVGSDTLSNATTGTVGFATTATAGSNVGSYAVTGSGLTANNGDYTFVQAGSNATALTINPLAVTLSGTRTYDGSANVAGSILTVTNVLVGDTVTVSGNGTLAAKDVGSEPLASLTGLTSSNPNYTVVGGSGDIAITPATLTYAASSASRTYGSANPTLTGTVTGFVGSDTLSNATTGTLGFGTTATAGSNVGSYAVTGTGLTANNGDYTFVQAGSNASALTINPLAVVLSGTRTYDGSANAAGSILTLTNALTGDTVTISGSGTLAAKDVGAEAVTSLSGLTSSNPNYTIVGGSGDVTVTPATLTYTAGSVARTYGSANPALTGTVTGFVGSDTLSNSTTGSLAFGSTATAGSNVGSYAVNGSGLTANNGDYMFVQAAGNATALTVNPLAVTLSGTRTYDGSASAAGSILTVTNALSGDTVTVSGSGTLAAKDVGAEALASLSGLTSSNPNYTVVGGSGDVTITPTTLTYTAGTATKVSGTANPAFTGTVTGLVGNDTLASATTGSATFTSPADSTSAPGSYAIDGSGLVASNGDYTFVQAAANAMALTVTAVASTPPTTPVTPEVADLPAPDLFTGERNGNLRATSAPVVAAGVGFCGSGSLAGALNKKDRVVIFAQAGSGGGC
jgi:filamentous hemagglutinin family protein